MKIVEEAVLELRVQGLYRIFCKKKIKADKKTIRLLACKMSDSEVIRTLSRRQNPGWWTFRYWGF